MVPVAIVFLSIVLVVVCDVGIVGAVDFDFVELDVSVLQQHGYFAKCMRSLPQYSV